MKLISFAFALFCAVAALAKTDATLFSQTVREDIKQDLNKNQETYRVNGRSPASVGPSPVEVIQQEQKSLDKVEKQLKQVGRPTW